MITAADVDAAETRVTGHVRVTPVVAFDLELAPPDVTVTLKLEQLQYTGSFKARGACNRILAAAERGELGDSGVVAASGGNAGLAVAYAARRNGVPARVYLPETAPAVKVDKLRELGATVAQVGSRYAEAQDAALADVAASGALLCHAYDQTEICAGQGTLGRELLRQAGGELDTVLVAVGGGGLLAGVARALANRVRVVGVEPELAPTMHAALDAGEPVTVDPCGVASDSLGASLAGEIGFDVAKNTGAGSVLVSDEDIEAARTLLWQHYRLPVEHGGATALAGLLSGAYRPQPGERVAVVVCGANTDLATLG